MIRKILFVAIILALTTKAVLSQEKEIIVKSSCPENCVCFPSVVNCMYLNFTSLPEDIPLDTEIL